MRHLSCFPQLVLLGKNYNYDPEINSLNEYINKQINKFYFTSDGIETGA